ncbi:radical SAM domain protein [Marvinbryantia formatexigens DSM 14469]|uniref:Radical SAM domain protein n=1 Tax=Marvinbryantia formatexigens DSM 14469 TaxID=478749 RepID=C6LMK1_9FIRM|nr:B12-binding domain-containing radical SAM protein [Marvinbryantia formatexigens]EET58153.1 radical SAM domain protein [Marvinbryantia formatexigens DSM 14469]UWO26182.1 B12-binding domain-containing radical SAM protein [Marvinbryantia formatexigens DSM 14469]SDH38607.1 Radical SAM superfamily protein [Marvinbryantia formatexigens]
MDILLAAINAKYIHSNPAVYSLKAYAEQFLKDKSQSAKPERGDGGQSAKPGRGNGDCAAACTIEIVEFTINQEADEILREIYKKQPEVLAFSCYIWNLEMVEKLLENLPYILPRTELWLGGPEVSWDAEAFLEEHLQVRGIMTGEGEETFAELAAWYARTEEQGGQMCTEEPRRTRRTYVEEAQWPEHAAGRTDMPADGGLSAIRGIVFRDDRGTVRTNAPRPLLAMDKLPFLYALPSPRSGGEETGASAGRVDNDTGVSAGIAKAGANISLEDFVNRIIYYESSRGCPFSCSYCLSSIEKSVRFRSTEKVKRELAFFLDHKVRQVKFVDRTFNCRHSHAMEIWRFIKEHDNGVTNFHFEIAADLLTEEELALLNTLRPGLVQMEIGVQSTNPRTLAEIDRISDFGRLSEIVKRLQSGENIHLHLDLIAGLPYEDYDSFVHSFNDVYRLYPEQLQLGFLKVLKGSKMHEKAQEYALCYRRQPVYEVLHTRWISYEELLRLKMVEEMVEVYYNSGQFTHTMRRLEREFAHPFAMYLELAEYYERSGLAGKKHTRMARFDILRDFIRTKTEAALYDELLLLDLYLRENSKSRPAWAGDIGGDKPAMLAFFKREEENRSLLSGYEGRSARQMMNMTHLELFHYAVCGDCREGRHWLLFDYRKRNPLTQEAAVYEVKVDG